MRFFQLHIILLLLVLKIAAQNNTGITTVVSPDAMSGKANCLFFSKNGFFYAGTSDGLFLFNGINMEPLTKMKDNLRNVTAINENEKGELWIGCADGSIYFFISNKLTEWKPGEGHPQKGISAIAFDNEQNLWLATKGEGLYVFYQNKLYNINKEDGLSDDYVYDLRFINQKMIAATDQGISFCSFNGKFKSIENRNTSNGLADNIVQTIADDPKDKNKIWLGFQNGCIGVFDLVQNKYTTAVCNTAPVNKILPLDNEVWVIDEQGIHVFTRNNYLKKAKSNLTSLLTICTDAEANLWIMGSNAIYKSSGEQLQTELTLSAQEAEGIQDIIIDVNGMYLLTSNGGLSSYEKKEAGVNMHFYKLPLHPNSDITCLYLDEESTISIGTMGDGVFLFNTITKEVSHITTVKGMERASVLSITGNKQHTWINALEGVWRYNKAEHQFVSFNTAAASGSAYIYYVMEDTKQRVWFATDGKGITVWEKGIYKSLREKEGLPAKVIYSIAEDKNGTIWCNSPGNGVYKYDGKQFFHFGLEQGLPDLNISALSTDKEGNVFSISANQCFFIQAKSGNIIPVASATEIGTLNTNLNSMFVQGNQIWFHAGTHIYSYHQPSYKKVFIPQTRIMNVQLFLNEMNRSRNTFAHSENNLSFSFRGFYYSDPSKVSYQFKLEKYNSEWQITKDGFINFPKLPPGNYTFRVRSSVNGNFNNASEATYSFIIEKPFWRTWWFIVLSIATFTAILVSIIKTREAEVQKIQQLQTEKIKSQYETLKSQVNPHFLFNSFNTLLNVIDEDPEKASEYVEHLSDFYRSIVNLREKDLIPLGDEIKIIEHYFFIQKKRFGQALHFESNITQEQRSSYSIPPLSLQLLAENALKHNIVSRDKPLMFEIAIENECLIVKNNLHPKQTGAKGEGLGLQNIKNRFLLMTGKEVTIDKSETYFIVTLPLINVL